MRKKVLSVLSLAVLAVSAQAKVIMTDDFETTTSSTSNTNWTTNSGTALYATPPAPAGHGTWAAEQQAGATARIGRGFTSDAGTTSVKLTWDMYTSTVASSSQRYYGQLSAGTAAAPSTSTGGFERIAANNEATKVYDFIYSNGATTTVNASALSVGWHTIQLTVVPGSAGSGKYTYQIDNNTPVTITSTGAVLLPTNVQLGQNVSNGTAGTGVDAYFDNIKVEEFEAAAGVASGPSPVDGDTNDANTTTLSWTPSATNTSTESLLFGTDPTLTAGGDQVLTNVSAATNSYNPGTLLDGTTYYWRVVSNNSFGDPTAGSIWSFTTAAAPEPASLSAAGLLGFGLLARRRKAKA